jgi:maleate cis-trans isomerase
MAPPGLTMVATVLGIRAHSDEDIGRALEALDQVAETYSRQKVDIVNLGGSPPVILRGVGSEQKLIERMEQASGTPATTSQTGAVAALKALGVTRVAVASPFDEYQNSKLKQYLEGQGFKVPAIQGLALPMEKVAFSHLSDSYSLVQEVIQKEGKDAEGIYIPCANWPVVENIAVLEEDTRLPVVTSLQAMLWHCLRKLGIGVKIEGYGRLFEIENIP